MDAAARAVLIPAMSNRADTIATHNNLVDRSNIATFAGTPTLVGTAGTAFAMFIVSLQYLIITLLFMARYTSSHYLFW